MKIIYISCYFLFISQIKYKHNIIYLIGYATLEYHVHISKIYIFYSILSRQPNVVIEYSHHLNTFVVNTWAPTTITNNSKSHFTFLGAFAKLELSILIFFVFDLEFGNSYKRRIGIFNH